MERDTIVVIVVVIVILVIFGTLVGVLTSKGSGNVGDANGQQWQDVNCSNINFVPRTVPCGASIGGCIKMGSCYSGQPHF